MRTFIIGVIIAVESSYNFVHVSGVDSIILMLLVLGGFVLAVAQDVRELRR